MKNEDFITLDESKDKLIGKVGTPERDAYEGRLMQESIDKFWAEKKWGVTEINSLLDEHFRTPYNPEK